jgi:hypothetical protein
LKDYEKRIERYDFTELVKEEDDVAIAKAVFHKVSKDDEQSSA